jgi:hypothetical protein
MNETIEFEKKERIPFSFVIFLVSVAIIGMAIGSTFVFRALEMDRSWSTFSFTAALVGFSLPFSGIYAGYTYKPKDERIVRLNRFGFWANLILYSVIVLLFVVQGLLRFG